jgi:hypothetical protein
MKVELQRLCQIIRRGAALFPLAPVEQRNEKIRSEMKRNEQVLEAKQSENTVYLFRFG